MPWWSIIENTTSSIQAIHSQLNNIKHVVICVDVVDLDNIWLCLWALVRTPNAHIHIVLAPRVLDLRVPTFAEIFEELAKKPLHFLSDPHSMETIIPGIRHPMHVNDYLYACSDEDRRESNNYLHLRGQEREEKMVAIMRRTADSLAGQLGYQNPDDILHPMEDLIELFKGPAAETQILVLGGGTFTEMVRLLAETELVPLAIVAMARTWYADVNVFANNYNDLMDLYAAMEIENLVKTRAIPTWFFPTECAKAKVKGGKVVRACPWDFTVAELIEIFKTAGDMESFEQAAAFTRETMTLAKKMYMFDVLTRALRIKEAADGPVNTFYPDEHIMEEIAHVLSPINKN
ncbi:hypothetical protein HD806DRAFT_520371 [Xylariaceae sp. AK1471]|nr:hypothetical protein HD806DRAFT_520371 [Xylariaceae sp. AK1471]